MPTDSKTAKKLLAAQIVQGITDMIVKSHIAVQEEDMEKRGALKEQLAQKGLELTHQIYEAIR